MNGRKFGRWTCLDSVEITEKGERKWLCRCDCGTERYVRERSLKSGGSQSCGCLRREEAARANGMDLEGRTFGELTVTERAENQNRTGGIWWKCQCSCGETYEVPGTLLVTGRRTHCGSRIHEQSRKTADITGQKFRKLTALYPTEQRTEKGDDIWHCRCDCGTETDVSYNSLMYSSMQSCGCQKKENDQNLKNQLTRVAGTSVDLVKSRRLPKDNTTGCKGVYRIRGKYVAKIYFQKKAYYLGVFDEMEDAAQARREAEEILFEATAAYYSLWKQRADQNPSWARQNPVTITVSQDSQRRLSVEFSPKIQPATGNKRTECAGAAGV